MRQDGDVGTERRVGAWAGVWAGVAHRPDAVAEPGMLDDAVEPDELGYDELGYADEPVELGELALPAGSAAEVEDVPVAGEPAATSSVCDEPWLPSWYSYEPAVEGLVEPAEPVS